MWKQWIFIYDIRCTNFQREDIKDIPSRNLICCIIYAHLFCIYIPLSSQRLYIVIFYWKFWIIINRVLQEGIFKYVVAYNIKF
jgi:hypothetical protein